MRRSRGNKAAAARMLGVTRARLHRKLDELDELDGDDDS